MKKLIVLFTVLFAFGLFGNVYASPILNGSFESGTDPGSYLTLYAGDTDIDNWTIESGAVGVVTSIDYIGGYWQAAQGARSIDLDGLYTPGAISQTFDTVSGASYQVLFEMAGNPDQQGVKYLRVSAAGSSQDYSFDTTGFTHTNMGWGTKSFMFQANDVSAKLLFQSLMPEGNAWGPALDYVRMASVAEPTTLLLLCFGLVGLTGLRRFKN